MSKRDRQTEQENEETKAQLTQLLQDKWRNTAISIFTYEGLPNGLTSQRIEDKLYLEGSGVFVLDSELSYLIGSYAQNGGLNFYGEPVAWRVIGTGYNKNFDISNSVLMTNNKLRKPSKTFIDFYINKLVNVECTIDVNLNAIKTPFIFSGEKTNLLTFQNLYNKVSGNSPIVYVDSALHNNSLNVFNTNAPYYVDKLMLAYNNYESRILNYLGLKYVSVEKQERLVVAEAENSEEYTDTNFACMFNARQDFVKQINAMFNLNMSVKINDELVREKTEDNTDGKLHNDNTKND